MKKKGTGTIMVNNNYILLNTGMNLGEHARDSVGTLVTLDMYCRVSSCRQSAHG